MSKSITVQVAFAGALLEGIGLDWKSQHRKLMNDPVLQSTVVEKTTVGADGKQRKMLCLPEEYLQGWLFKVHPDKVRPAIRGKVIRYQRECYKVLHLAFTQGKAATEYRVLAVDSKRAAGRLMTEVMRDVLLMDGKTPNRHNYRNEHCLINWCLTGNFSALDESTLNAAQLNTLAELRRRDAVLIARGLDYDERKTVLHQYALDLAANDHGRLTA